MHGRSRLSFMVSDQHQLITIRPIGALTSMSFVDQLFEAYAGLAAPWAYFRVNDLRRWEGHLDPVARSEITRRWAELTAGATYQAHVAIVTIDRTDKFRRPQPAPKFPHETVCDFTDYHEAVGWLLSNEREAFLAGLGAAPVRRRDENLISVE